MSPLNQSDSARRLRRGLAIGGAVVAIVLVVIVAEGLISRAYSNSQVHDWTERQSVLAVRVAEPSTQTNAAALELPGRLQAYMSAPLYARVDGYLKSWKYDIGAKVREGDLLAEIETPDLDQQLIQARADLASSKANAALAKTTAARWNSMMDTDSVSKQEVDEKAGDLSTKNALVNAAQANVNRLMALKAFARVVAPFSGTVTARSTDVGALISAGGGGRPELFEVSDTRKLRLYVSVPQNYVPSVPPGTKAMLTVPEHANKQYAATVENSAQSVNPTSGTTLMQLVVDNANGELMSGGYASVHLALAGEARPLTVPSSALIFDAKGLSLAVVDADNKIQIKPVTVGRDLGNVIEIGSGLTAGDRVVDSPPDGIVSGTPVQVVGGTDGATTAPAKRAEVGKKTTNDKS